MSRVIHLTSWLTAKGGGIPPVIRALQSAQIKQGWDAQAAGLLELTATSDASANNAITGSIVGPPAFGYSPALRAALLERQRQADVLHVHGLWMYPGLLARQLTDASGAVRVVSPHGMLEPWALKNSRWKKRVAGWCFERRNLETASCLHALCAAEATSFKHYGLNNPVAVIPNGIDPGLFQNLPDRAGLENKFPALRGRRWMLFLSRIHPKKGLPHLLRAWAKILNSQPSALNTWCLVIAGPDESNHEAEMKQLVLDLGVSDSVYFTGRLQGEDKRAALGGSELFVLPSFSEGFSMAILEAAAAGLPVLLTPQCNFPELAKAGGAVEVLPEAASCEAGLRQLLALTDAERQAMGQQGRNLVGHSYSWTQIADQMLGVYDWLTEGGPLPACVVKSS